MLTGAETFCMISIGSVGCSSISVSRRYVQLKCEMSPTNLTALSARARMHLTAFVRIRLLSGKARSSLVAHTIRRRLAGIPRMIRAHQRGPTEQAQEASAPLRFFSNVLRRLPRLMSGPPASFYSPSLLRDSRSFILPMTSMPWLRLRPYLGGSG